MLVVLGVVDVECLNGLCMLIYVLYGFYVIYWLMGGVMGIIVIIINYVKCGDVVGMLYVDYFEW